MKRLRMIAVNLHACFVIAARTRDAAAAKVMKIHEELVRHSA